MRKIYSAMIVTVFSNTPRRMIVENINSSAYVKVSHVRKATKKERAEFIRKEKMYQDQPIGTRDSRKMRLAYRKEQERIRHEVARY